MKLPRNHREQRNDTPQIARPEELSVPAVLPQIVLEAIDAETLIVTVNGNKLAATPIARSEIAKMLTELVARLGSPTRVEVREMDGSIHADILTPPAPPSPFAPPADVPSAATPPSLLEFIADGFVPGEDVALALILRHTSASPTGAARSLLDRSETVTMTGEVILLGRISGTTSVQRID